ncbi:B3 domain-containing transcription factor VRN1-like [Eucalyptus grandis]|uniref:B3 domain-containing transcription factor VRN1-like n=1 Tax=Eucalyptus grandis TaxID=71139 RepID=UPI00192EF4D0|nr:B3 domain-containing transcription factor VRN1-like [Eucalyptus grandis]
MVGGRHFESQTPHFFKIILSDALQNGRLGIPKKFVRKYGSNLSDLVFLQVPSGQAWEVELVRRTDGVWLRRGWPDFVKHYAIKHGHFLVFRYEGGSAFRVVIFDKSASEIKYPIITELPKREENEGDTLVEVFEDHFDRPLRIQSKELPSLTLLSPPSKKKKTNECLYKQAVGGGASNIVCDVNAGLNSSCWKRERPFRGGEKSEALKRAASFQSPNPFFLTLMQPSLIRHSLIVCSQIVPAGFVRRYLEHSHLKGTLRVGYRTWSVKLRIYPQPNSNSFKGKISAGWFNFARDNALQVGDICIFELLDSDLIVLKVSIFRWIAFELRCPNGQQNSACLLVVG